MSFDNRYQGKRVLVTGDTGFKGAWLAFWLKALGAEVTGLALPPEYENGVFSLAELDREIRHIDGDIRDYDVVRDAVGEADPDFVFHLAAQALVRESYREPVMTTATNVLGTVHVMEAVRERNKPCAVVMVTSDKCYENRETSYRYREDDPMGGHDLYSASKGCAELMISAYRRSFLGGADSVVAMASARAGNVIGPGDWAEDRIVPDAMRAFLSDKSLIVRNPESVRPWQHVLEPLSGYLRLGALLASKESSEYREAWNFGPEDESARTVADLADAMVNDWPGAKWDAPAREGEPHEAALLQLDISKAKERLAWRPVWRFEEAVTHTVRGYRELMEYANDSSAVRAFLGREVESYMASARTGNAEWGNPPLS